MNASASLRLLSLIAGCGVVLGAPRTADACSAPRCWGGAFVPGEAAQVPANLPGLVWQPTTSIGGEAAPGSENVVLATAAAPETPLAFTATELPGGTYLLVPDAPLAPDTAYVVRDENTCDGTPGVAIGFTTAASAPLPSSLGTLSAAAPVRGALQVATSAGSCSAEVDAVSATVELALVADAQPWRALLLFETLVDGQPWRASPSINALLAPGGSWMGRGRDLIYRVCATDDQTIDRGVTAGPHEVTMRATLAGTSTVVTSQTVTVELSCAGDIPPVCEEDPAACDDGDDDDGGGCDTGPGRPGGTGWPLLALGLVLLAVRRRAA